MQRRSGDGPRTNAQTKYESEQAGTDSDNEFVADIGFDPH